MQLPNRRISRANEVLNEVKKLNEAVDGLAGEAGTVKLTRETVKAKEALTNAQIEHEKHKEEWAKKERETTHMVGLQKQRGEQELELAKKAAEQERVAAVREAELAVREGNLETERKMMDQQIQKLNEDLHTQIEYLKNDVLNTVIKAVPNFNVDMVLDPHGSRDAAAQRKAIAKGNVDPRT